MTHGVQRVIVMGCDYYTMIALRIVYVGASPDRDPRYDDLRDSERVQREEIYILYRNPGYFDSVDLDSDDELYDYTYESERKEVIEHKFDPIMIFTDGEYVRPELKEKYESDVHKATFQGVENEPAEVVEVTKIFWNEER
jgi:hypothetical protein